MYKKILSLFLFAFLSLNILASDRIEELKKNANLGDVDAQYQLAQCYDYGNGVRYNVSEAERWYLEAAKQGHISAQFHLGVILQSKSQYEEAVRWYDKAASSGHQRSQNNLEVLKAKLNTSN